MARTPRLRRILLQAACALVLPLAASAHSPALRYVGRVATEIAATPHGVELLRASVESGVRFDLLAAVARVESRFDANAISPSGSLVLMQLQPRTGRATARRLGIPWRPFDPATNARLGAAYLAELLDRYGCERVALV